MAILSYSARNRFGLMQRKSDLMKWDSLALAIFPPAIAIVAELLNWMSVSHLFEASQRIVSEHLSSDPRAANVVTYTAKGAASLSGIQSTFISVLTAAAVTSHDAANGYWPLLIAVVVLLAFGLIVVHIR